ncbi:amidohydrolase family protein [Amycolatopsis sp. NBC_01286]|uniref:amidohydrolase family protein n=1 Tax=Amycolatopsis sp. NBC_01286 TaxID=2903560 RepID=UPI002E155BB6|nr:amidohydrolase family protein [Amycolatopsis sp. NBC_01286]
MTTRLLLTAATVVDPRDGGLTESTDVLIEDGRILDVRPGIEAAAQRVDAAGTYVVPGYNDMHAHPLGKADPAATLELMLVHGITGFRQMGGSIDLLRRRAAGKLGFPEAAPALLATPGPLLTPANASTVDQVVAAIREQHAEGADFIKAGLVTRDVFFDAQAEARRLGLPIVGHLPAGIDVEKASRLGMKSIEHLGPGVALFACCSGDHDHIRETAAAGGPQLKLPPFKIPFLGKIMDRVLRKLVINPLNLSKPADIANLSHAVGTFDRDRAHVLAERFAADGTWQVPTLIRIKTQELCDSPEFAEDPDLTYITPSTRKAWRAAAARFAGFPADARATFTEAYERQLDLTKLFDDAGVKMLAGTDSSGAAWVVPGAALHREFAEFARAGLTPLRILQLTTTLPAEFLGTTDTMGTVEPGKNADLVLLADNPLTDVKHLGHIAGVVRAGKYYPAADLAARKEKLAGSVP